MKKRMPFALIITLLFLNVCPAKASIYKDAYDYILNVMLIITNDPSNDISTFQDIHICQYDDISKVWGRDDPHIEDAFMIDAYQMPDEGYLISLSFKDMFFALVSLDGTIISIQNMTQNAKISAALVNSFKAVDRSKIGEEEYSMVFDYIQSLLIRDVALALLNWDSSPLFADGNLNSNVKNVWH